jgi:hypothetical protein
MSARVVHIEKAQPSVAAAEKMRSLDRATIEKSYIRLVYLHGCVD